MGLQGMGGLPIVSRERAHATVPRRLEILAQLSACTGLGLPRKRRNRRQNLGWNNPNLQISRNIPAPHCWSREDIVLFIAFVCVAVTKVTPVTLPPGRLRLATRPSLTGSPALTKTIGIVDGRPGRGLGDIRLCPLVRCVRPASRQPDKTLASDRARRCQATDGHDEAPDSVRARHSVQINAPGRAKSSSSL
jgi:hypothetical protein